MRWELERNDVHLWAYKGKSESRRPRPKLILENPTDHYVCNASLTGSTRRVSWDYGATFGDLEYVVPRGPAFGPYSMFCISDPDGKLQSSEDSAINSALAKLRNVQFDLGVFLGELPETIAFVKSGAQECLDGYVDASKRADRADRIRAKLRKLPPTRSNLKRINNLTNLISTIWLSYRYGVMPLYYALYDALEAFQKGLDKPRFVRVKATSKEVVDGKYYDGENPVLQTGSIRTRVSITATVSPDFASSLGMDNPALIAWELFPLSFVFDWFINVGDYLTGLLPRGISNVLGTVSTKVDAQLKADSLTIREAHLVIECSPVIGHTQSYFRRVFYGLPQPRLYYNPVLNMKRYIDAFALMKLIFAKADKYAVKK